MTNEAHLLRRTIAGTYRLVRVRAAGAFGTVFHAEQFFCGHFVRTVAVKVSRQTGLTESTAPYLFGDALRDALVPNLLLQPLVENAIRHGIARRADAGLLELRATRAGGRLRIELINEGQMLPESFSASTANGIGLRNTLTRLEHLYGDDASLRLENRPPAAVAAIVVAIRQGRK